MQEAFSANEENCFLHVYNSHNSRLFLLFFHRAVCDCAKRTKNKGNNVFGIQYYSECWTGPGNVTYMTYGKSNKCIDGKFEACSNRLSDGKLCAGRGYVNYVYELL